MENRLFEAEPKIGNQSLTQVKNSSEENLVVLFQSHSSCNSEISFALTRNQEILTLTVIWYSAKVARLREGTDNLCYSLVEGNNSVKVRFHLQWLDNGLQWYYGLWHYWFNHTLVTNPSVTMEI